MDTAIGYPADYPRVSPYMVVRDGAAALRWYSAILEAEVVMELRDPQGKLRHAELRIGDSVLMLAEENPDFPMVISPQALGGTPVHLHVYVLDVDAVIARALAAGASEVLPAADSGEDRRGGITDPFGHLWWIATRIEQVTRAELQQRHDAAQAASV